MAASTSRSEDFTAPRIAVARAVRHPRHAGLGDDREQPADLLLGGQEHPARGRERGRGARAAPDEDRSKDLVKSDSEWISSIELENAPMAHPKVRDRFLFVTEVTKIGVGKDDKKVVQPLYVDGGFDAGEQRCGPFGATM